jgi:DNA-binding Lrp family transcriptional regulator
MQEIDQRDRELLTALQGDIPLLSTPYAVVGQMIDMSEKEVIKRIDRLKRDGFIRALAAQFDNRALGYRSCLVAARVAPERVDDAAAIVSAHPGVTQNYRRNHEFNLWFTIAVAPSSKLGLEKTIEVLGDEAECEVVRALPTLRMFKTAGADGEQLGDVDGSGAAPQELTALETECVRILQQDLPLQPRPFDTLARSGSVSAEELIATAKSLLARGQMRRFGAVIAVRKPGFTASAMGVWSVPQDRADAYAQTMMKNRAVSHCYVRPTYEDWPYNLYTTVHGRSVDECESIINDIAIDTGLTEKRALYPTKEYKQTRVSLFGADADLWEAAHEAPAAATVAS